MHPTTQLLPTTNPGAISLSDDERQPCEIWTRVMGYHRPMSSFNTGKKGEFHERRYFRESTAGLADAAPSPVRPAPPEIQSAHPSRIPAQDSALTEHPELAEAI